MELLHKRGPVSATELVELIPNAPSNSTVRTLLKILEDRGLVCHREEAGKYLYFALESRDSAARNALGHVVETFFDGSLKLAVTSLLEDRQNLSEEDIDALQALIRKAREEGR